MSLSRSSLGPRSWRGVAAASLDDPALYDGVAWRRALGYMADLLLLAVLGGILWLLLGLLGILTFGLLLPLQVAALAVLPFAYYSGFIAGQGATPGMQLFDIEIRSTEGERLDLIRALLMTLLFYASVALTSWLVLLVALFNSRQRTLHDYLSGALGLRRSRLIGTP